MKLAAFAIAVTVALPASPAATQPAEEAVPGFEFNLPANRPDAPGLAEYLRYERQSALHNYRNRRREFIAEVEGSHSAALENFQHVTDWSVAGSTGDLVSLSAEIYTYLGGAHGNTTFDSVLWDVADERTLEFTELFAERYRAMAEIDAVFCERLAELQAQRLGEDPGGFGRGCPVLHEQTLVPAGAPGEPMTAIRVLVPPYVAGPYVAGTFEVEVPMTRELMALVRPEFRASFSAQQ